MVVKNQNKADGESTEKGIINAYEAEYTDLVIVIAEKENEKEFDVDRFAFQKISSADTVRGDVTDDGVVYVNGSAKYYPSDDELDNVPRNVINKISEDYTLLADVDAGWDTWAGRPEFDDSRTYVDVTDAKIIS